MRRFSTAWWLAVLPTSLLAGATTWFALGGLFDWELFERIAVVATVVLLVDLATAAWIERFAPTRIVVGPGERVDNSDPAAEQALVIDGFQTSPHGTVLIRGETWPAVCRQDNPARIGSGSRVRIVDRIGLCLVVATSPCGN